MSALDKVLALAGAGSAPVPPSAAELVRLAGEDLERIALMLADSDEDDEDDDGEGGDDDYDDEDDDDEDAASSKKKFKGKLKKKAKGKGKVAATAVLDAMVALSQLQGGENISLSVLTMEQRRKPSAHTIAGSTDYPIPDRVHLSAAIARYKQGKLAGHSKESVRRHILHHANRLGVKIELAQLDNDDAAQLITLARGQAPEGVPTAMHHGIYDGEHEHHHAVVSVHTHKHRHNHDNTHRCGEGQMSGMAY